MLFLFLFFCDTYYVSAGQAKQKQKNRVLSFLFLFLFLIFSFISLWIPADSDGHVMACFTLFFFSFFCQFSIFGWFLVFVCRYR